MRGLGIGCVIAASLLILAIAASLWIWSATSSWSNDEGTAIFLVTLFPATPLVIIGGVLSMIGSWQIRRNPPAAPSSQVSQRHMMSWARGLSVLALLVVGLGIGLPVFAAVLGGGFQMSTFIESVTAAVGALAIWSLAGLCQRLAGTEVT